MAQSVPSRPLGLATLISALCIACPSPSPPGDVSVPAEPPSGAAAATPDAADPAVEPEAAAPDDVPGTARTCDFLPTEVPVGGVTCPEGCVMVKGAPLHQTQGCAMTGFQFEVALACLRLPLEVLPEGNCYRNADGHIVMTAITYPALAERGWEACPDDVPWRGVPPCADRLVPPSDAPSPTEESP